MLSPEESYKLFQKIGLNVRGFEFISEEQLESDCPDHPYSSIIKPKRSTSKSAGYDFYSPISFELQPGEHIKIPTGIGYARNVLVVRAADIVVAISGHYGTLSEIAFALSEEKVVLGIDTWDIEGIKKIKTPQEAIKGIKKHVK